MGREKDGPVIQAIWTASAQEYEYLTDFLTDFFCGFFRFNETLQTQLQNLCSVKSSPIRQLFPLLPGCRRKTNEINEFFSRAGAFQQPPALPLCQKFPDKWDPKEAENHLFSQPNPPQQVPPQAANWEEDSVQSLALASCQPVPPTQSQRSSPRWSCCPQSSPASTSGSQYLNNLLSTLRNSLG